MVNFKAGNVYILNTYINETILHTTDYTEEVAWQISM